MKELTEWWREIDGGSRRWLVLGKGPSFETRDRYDLAPYTTIAINHVVREMRVDVVSAVNYDVVGDCADAIYENARFLLMPAYPHSIPGDAPHPLEFYFDTYPVLTKMSAEGRLVWYNLSSDTLVPGSPVIDNGPFSIIILFNLLGAMGGRQVRTLGVDGGQSYGGSFADMVNRTRLANGMKSYDYQFKDMMAAVRRYNLEYAPLNSDSQLRLRMWWQVFRQRFRSNPKRAIKRWLSAPARMTADSRTTDR